MRYPQYMRYNKICCDTSGTCETCGRFAVDVVYAKHVVYAIYAIYVVYAVRSMDVQARLENEGCPNSSALGKENLRSAQRISSAAKTALLRSPTRLAFNILAFL